MLNIFDINSQIKFAGNTNNFLHRKDYLRTLVTELVSEHIKERIYMKSVPRSIKNRIRETTEITEDPAKPPINFEGRCNGFCGWRKKSQNKNNL